MNVLTHPVISTGGDSRLSLPELLAAMARDEVHGFPALRPHQRPAWHMFLVQLATLAASKAECSIAPESPREWLRLLRGLSPDYSDDEPWQLITDSFSTPAFFQPPDPGGLKWTEVSTPDSLDILITARNHDVKQSMALKSHAEDWLYALVSLQTSAGFDGRGNYGIARMNGGSSSRPMLGLAPGSDQDFRVNPSRWWRRDMQQLLSRRKQSEDSLGRIGGPSLLWCLDWPEKEQLDVRALDPLFIEVSRRVRLRGSNGNISALRANSGATRIDAKMFKGNVGDPWAPVHRKEGKSLTLGSGDFDYKRLADLMFGADWEIPLLAKLAPGETADHSLLVTEALARGNSKSEGFRSRVLPVPAKVQRMLGAPKAAEVCRRLLLEVKEFDLALRDGIALLAAGGEYERVDKGHYEKTMPARRRFDRQVDRLFFPHLWNRIAAFQSGSSESMGETTRAFLQDLLCVAKAELERSLRCISCAAVLRPKAEARCRRRFHARLHKIGASPRVADSEQVNSND